MQMASSSHDFFDSRDASLGKIPTEEIGNFNAYGQVLDVQNKARKIEDLGSNPSNKLGLKIKLYDNLLADEQLASRRTCVIIPTQFNVGNQDKTCSILAFPSVLAFMKCAN